MRPSIRAIVRGAWLLGQLALVPSCTPEQQAPPSAMPEMHAKRGSAFVLAADTSDLVAVTARSFVRAETDLHFAKLAAGVGVGKLDHRREMTPIDKQDVARLNRDALFSTAVFDLDAAPVTITLPNPGKRFMSMQLVSQDHYVIDVVYGPATFTCSKERAATRYVGALIRTLADPRDDADMNAARALQDNIRVEQAAKGHFEVPRWDPKSQARVRGALQLLGASPGDAALAFGPKDKVDPIAHLIGAAMGWGGTPRDAATYVSVVPRANDGRIVHRIAVKDVPVDGFWSISVYNANGYFEKNDHDVYSLSDYAAVADPSGTFTIQFGGCQSVNSNCLPIMPGWNYTVRLYRPRREILDGRWTFPEARPIHP
jgi:hypothetical protein